MVSSELNTKIIGEMFSPSHNSAYLFTETHRGNVGNLTASSYVPIVVANSLSWTIKSMQVLEVEGAVTGIVIAKANGDAVPFEVRNQEIRFMAEGMSSSPPWLIRTVPPLGYQTYFLQLSRIEDTHVSSKLPSGSEFQQDLRERSIMPDNDVNGTASQHSELLSPNSVPCEDSFTIENRMMTLGFRKNTDGVHQLVWLKDPRIRKSFFEAIANQFQNRNH